MTEWRQSWKICNSSSRPVCLRTEWGTFNVFGSEARWEKKVSSVSWETFFFCLFQDTSELFSLGYFWTHLVNDCSATWISWLLLFFFFPFYTWFYLSILALLPVCGKIRIRDILHWCDWNLWGIIVIKLIFRHVLADSYHATLLFFLNRPSRKLSSASKYSLSTDGNLACGHFIDLKGRCFTKLNWNCLNSNTVNKKNPSFPPPSPPPSTLKNQSSQMSVAVNAKIRGKIGKSRALKVYDQTCIHIYIIPHLCFSH